MDYGPACPKCGSRESRVYDTRTGPEGTIRRRRCVSCNWTYKTTEVHYDAHLGKTLRTLVTLRDLINEVLRRHGTG